MSIDRRPFLWLAGLGLALSLALEVLHVRAYLLPTASSFCAIGARLDCASVALSRFSVVLGVPVPLWGALGFVAILIAAIRRSLFLLVLTALGALASLALLIVEVALIGALCLLCEAVHAVCFALFALAWRKRASFSSSFGNRDDLVTIFAPVLGILVALVLFVPRYLGIFGWKGDMPFAHGKTPEGYPWLGAESPTLVVHEFTDYACPHCRVASARTLKRLADHPKSLRVVRRQYPRGRCHVGRETICVAVRAAYCAEEQGKFWQTDRWLFEHPDESARRDLPIVAAEVGLDLEKLRACMERTDIYERAVADAELAVRKRFPGTPYYLVGERRIPEEELAKLIAALP
jgi:uncharacterized membrane protein